ncbi:single-stranded DNA-binding protein [Nocardioides KLBMP 9356]|uniref:Single-stranded DNA-binding protein n=1 Tax=Nocardioides potassii TaxID=2911371 RepID=A0ABS9H9B3_9ACTN|nr:single-stranded DNA-binding protein [Nocardioides potassii]MCF6377807.1 single-stranded DNA-binding protein [Nocardioides potassii]
MTTAQKNKPSDPIDSGDLEVATNDVRLVGRLSADPVVVELPSGDALVTFRISVTRPAPRGSATGAKGQRVDSVPCTAWTPRLRRSVLAWRAGDLVEVSGSVRCRFYQAGGATRSRVEVEAATARIIRRSSAA